MAEHAQKLPLPEKRKFVGTNRATPDAACLLLLQDKAAATTTTTKLIFFDCNRLLAWQKKPKNGKALPNYELILYVYVYIFSGYFLND